MRLIDSFVQSTSSLFTSTSSPYVWVAFVALKNVHAGWSWYRRFHLYTQQKSWTQLFAGLMVNYTLGEWKFFRVTSQSILVATRILEATQQLIITSRAFDEWVKVIKGEYCSSRNVEWPKDSSRYFSPSTLYWYGVKKAQLSERVEKIALTSWGLISAMTTACMKIMDVYDAIYPTEAVQFDANQEMFVNVSKWLDAAVENKPILLKTLKKNEPVFSYILSGTGIEFSTILGGFDFAMNKVENTQKWYDNMFGRTRYPLKLIQIKVNS